VVYMCMQYMHDQNILLMGYIKDEMTFILKASIATGKAYTKTINELANTYNNDAALLF